MKASEIMLNNYVKDHLGRVLKVVGLKDDNVYLVLSNKEKIRYNIKTIQGLELTEEILLKCGFEKKIWKAKNSVYYELNKLEILLEDSYYINGVTYYKSGLLFEYHPKHLHQLQNLYFCLYGEELTINL
jgi:hypothetical protein